MHQRRLNCCITEKEKEKGNQCMLKNRAMVVYRLVYLRRISNGRMWLLTFFLPFLLLPLHYRARFLASTTTTSNSTHTHIHIHTLTDTHYIHLHTRTPPPFPPPPPHTHTRTFTNSLTPTLNTSFKCALIFYNSAPLAHIPSSAAERIITLLVCGTNTWYVPPTQPPPTVGSGLVCTERPSLASSVYFQRAHFADKTTCMCSWEYEML